MIYITQLFNTENRQVKMWAYTFLPSISVSNIMRHKDIFKGSKADLYSVFVLLDELPYQD